MEIRAQPGPQEMFLATTADIAILGGAAGGGKSYALLMEPLRHLDNPDFGCVTFRRTTKQVRNEGGLWDTALKLYSRMGTEFKSSTLECIFPSKMRHQFAHLEHEKNVFDWQGSQIPLICCEETEQVRLQNGILKPIAEITVGDCVMTLQGPKPVIWIGERRLEECVKLQIENQTQVHSTTHKILTSEGWVSYDDKCDEFHPFSIFFAKQFHFFYKSVKQFASKYPALEKLRDNLCAGLQRLSLTWQLILGYLGWQGTSSCKEPVGLGNDFGWFRSKLPVFSPQLSVHLFAVRSLPVPDLLGHASSLSESFDEPPYAQPGSRSVNWLSHYSFLIRQYGVLVFSLLRKILNVFPSLTDVEGQSQRGWPWDDPGKAQKCIRRELQYAHPYRGSIQKAEGLFELVPCKITPCGKRWVRDLTVQDESHYITETGLVNKNCFDELTHFSAKQFWYMSSRNRSTSGVSGYIRATCNADADSWVRVLIDWWIDPVTGYPIPERAGVLRYFLRINDELHWADSTEELKARFGDDKMPKSLTFIPAKLEDNPALLEIDPQYKANLDALPLLDRMRLKEGNWNVKAAAGMFFKPEWFELVDALPGQVTSVRYWDRASSEVTPQNPDPDWTVGLKLSRSHSGLFYIADVCRLRGSPSKVEQAIVNLAKQDGLSTTIILEQDPGQAGVAEKSYYSKLLAGFHFKFKKPTTDKKTRAKPASAQAEVGNLKMLRAPWNEAVLKVLTAFPEGKHDDDVDALSGALNSFFEEPVGDFEDSMTEIENTSILEEETSHGLEW